MKVIEYFQIIFLLVVQVYGKVRNDCVCGIMNEAYGVAGSNGAKYAWMVSLITPNKQAFCGGVLISDQHVLTAGPCVNFE